MNDLPWYWSLQKDMVTYHTTHDLQTVYDQLRRFIMWKSLCKPAISVTSQQIVILAYVIAQRCITYIHGSNQIISNTIAKFVYVCQNEIHIFLQHNFNSSPPSAAYMRQWTRPSLVQVMACRLFGVKPLPEPILAYCQLDCWQQISVKF